MKTFIAFIVVFTFSANVFIAAQQAETENYVRNEFVMRNGLPNFFLKALRGDSVKVAYLGGSITAQEGWRVFSFNWFKEQFPNAAFKQINAAIGGTGSDFGVFRLQENVLQYKPDLVFVEFAVNDGNTPSSKIIRSMEGIVRQINEANPYTDICFVYTIKAAYLETEEQGMLPNSAINMEKVADHYGIPSINFGFEVADQVSTMQLIMAADAKEIDGAKVFSRDGVHPYPKTGHVIYHQVWKRSFESMIAANPIAQQKQKLSKPLAADYFANTKMVDAKDVQLSEHWTLMNLKEKSVFSPFSNYLQFIGKAAQSGETLIVHFKGRAIGAYDAMGPDAGRVVVEIDGMVKDTIYRFDAYCTYRRMNYFVIDGLENKKHKVAFRTLSEPFDKAAILSKRK